MIRPKKCMKCGGMKKLQMGKNNLSLEDMQGYTPSILQPKKQQPLQQSNPFREAWDQIMPNTTFQKIDTWSPYGCPPNHIWDSASEKCIPNEGYMAMPNALGKPFSIKEKLFEDKTDNQLGQPSKQDKSFFINPSLIGEGLLTGLTYLGREMEQNRQDDYARRQLSDLGQNDYANYQQFQPNPFSLYARYGGQIKKSSAYNYDSEQLGFMEKGGLSPNKARQILHDKKVHGKPLTDKQRRFFGAASKGHTNYK